MQRPNESSSLKMSLTEVKNNVNKTGQNWKLRRKKLPNFKLEAIRIEIKAIAIKMNVNNDFKCYLLGI